MKSLILLEQGLTLHAQGDALVVQRAAVVIERVRPEEIGEVQLYGNVAASPAAIALLLGRGIDTIFLSGRGRYRGRLQGRGSKQIELRVAQYDRLRQPDFALGLARRFVFGKLVNQRTLLLRAQREHGQEGLADAIGFLRRAGEAAAEALALDSLRGHEGSGSAAYFGAFGLAIRNPAFTFKGRNRRPPRDPVNAMLSFGYALLANMVEGMVLRAGLDPMLGAYHQPEYGRPSLALDLMEELRPVLVDSLVLKLVNRREVAAEDFEDPGEEVESVWGESGDGPCGAPPGFPAPAECPRAVWLGEAGRRVFFRAWSKRLHDTVFYAGTNNVRPYEEIALQQVYRLGRALKGEQEYEAFMPR